MTMSRSVQSRALSDDEREFVAKTRPDTMAAMPSFEIHELRKHIAELRRKARDTLYRQRREMRGKARPHGATAATSDRGSAIKERALSAALKRVNRAITRDAAASKKAQQVNSEAALRLKRAHRSSATHPAPGMTRNEGMRSLPNAGEAPSGALSQEGQRPVLERSHKVR